MDEKYYSLKSHISQEKVKMDTTDLEKKNLPVST